VDGHEADQIRAHACLAPALGKQVAQDRCQASFAVVLERMQRGSGGAAEGGTPLQLHQAGRQIEGQADRHAGRLEEPSPQRLQAGWTDRRSFPTAARADRRQEQVEQR
jgi:hypothetical protein